MRREAPQKLIIPPTFSDVIKSGSCSASLCVIRFLLRGRPTWSYFVVTMVAKPRVTKDIIYMFRLSLSRCLDLLQLIKMSSFIWRDFGNTSQRSKEAKMRSLHQRPLELRTFLNNTFSYNSQSVDKISSFRWQSQLTLLTRGFLALFDSCSTVQETPCLLWNPNVLNRVHKNPTLAPILS